MMKKILQYFGNRLVSLAVNFIIVGLLILGVTQFNSWFGVEDDHPIEELAEAIIKSEMGIDVDLTPTSKEDQS